MNVTSIATSAVAISPALPTASSARAGGQPMPAPSDEVAKTTAAKAAKPSDAALQQAVDASNKVLESKTSNELHFAIEKGTGINVVKLISRNTGETLLQFPSEAMLQIAKGIDQVTGAIIQRKA
jgi:flagellar protein FlaG